MIFEDVKMEEIKILFASVLQIAPTQVNEAITNEEIVSWTSFNHLNLIAVFEEKFGISIEPEEILIMAENFGKFQEIILKKCNCSQ